MNEMILAVFLATVLSVTSTLGLAEEGDNLLGNDGFEQDFTGWSKTVGWSIESAISCSGNR